MAGDASRELDVGHGHCLRRRLLQALHIHPSGCAVLDARALPCLRDASGLEIGGLVETDVFDAGGLSAASEAVRILRCNRMCMAQINCHIWQYSNVIVCWIENPGFHEIIGI